MRRFPVRGHYDWTFLIRFRQWDAEKRRGKHCLPPYALEQLFERRLKGEKTWLRIRYRIG